MAKSKRVRRRVGDVIAIPLDDGSYGFGRVLTEPLMVFYDLRRSEVPVVDEVICAPVAFIVYVMNYAVTGGEWPVIGNAPLSEELLEEPVFFKKDPISQNLSIYRDSTGEETPATQEQCEGLECAAVWDPDHIVDRLVDCFAGRPNKWIDSLRP